MTNGTRNGIVLKYSENESAVKWNIQVGTKTVVESLLAPADQAYDFFNGRDPVDVVLASLVNVVDRLKKEQGEDVASWRIPAAPMAFINQNFLKIPQAGVNEAFSLTPAMNRGTENNMTVFKDGKPIAWDVTPPGQSGFVAKDGSTGPHYKDQVKMYQEFGKKRTYLFADEVDENKVDEVVLTY